MKSAEDYFNENYGKDHLDRCIELNDKQSIYSLMEEFADSLVKNLIIPDIVKAKRREAPVCRTCDGTRLVYIDDVIKNTLCPDC
jgi:hypothetical protein